MPQDIAGFRMRVAGAVIDAVLYWIVTAPLLLAAYGRAYFQYDGFKPLGVWDFLLTWVLPILGCLVFWMLKSATPGKLVLGMRIVDAGTGGKPSNAQFAGRLLGSMLSALCLGAGYLWAAFDSRHQTWHDRMAGTLVVRDNRDEAAHHWTVT